MGGLGSAGMHRLFFRMFAPKQPQDPLEWWGFTLWGPGNRETPFFQIMFCKTESFALWTATGPTFPEAKSPVEVGGVTYGMAINTQKQW